MVLMFLLNCVSNLMFSWFSHRAQRFRQSPALRIQSPRSRPCCSTWQLSFRSVCFASLHPSRKSDYMLLGISELRTLESWILSLPLSSQNSYHQSWKLRISELRTMNRKSPFVLSSSAERSRSGAAQIMMKSCPRPSGRAWKWSLRSLFLFPFVICLLYTSDAADE